MRDTLRAPGRMAFDATPKRDGATLNAMPVRAWPPLIEMRGEVQAKVGARWGTLFPRD